METQTMADGATISEIIPDFWVRFHNGITTFIIRGLFPLNKYGSCNCELRKATGNCEHFELTNKAADQIGEQRFAEVQAKKAQVA